MSDPTVEKAIRDEFNRTRGRLAGFIEACGLSERQERGMIATMKSLTYDAEKALIDLVQPPTCQ